MAPCAELLRAAAGPARRLRSDSATTTTTPTCRGRSPAAAVHVLADDRTTLTIRGERVELVGLRFWPARRATSTRLLRGATGWTMLARARSAALRPGGEAERAAGALGPHPRRADRPARRRGAGRAQVSRLPKAPCAREHDDVRQPRRRHGLRPVPDQLPARSRAAHADAGTPARRQEPRTFRLPPHAFRRSGRCGFQHRAPRTPRGDPRCARLLEHARDRSR